MGEVEQFCKGVVSTGHELEAGLYHVEQQRGHKGKGERDQAAAKEKVVQMQVCKKQVWVLPVPSAGLMTCW